MKRYQTKLVTGTILLVAVLLLAFGAIKVANRGELRLWDGLPHTSSNLFLMAYSEADILVGGMLMGAAFILLLYSLKDIMMGLISWLVLKTKKKIKAKP